jgi:hypothetical protein
MALEIGRLAGGAQYEYCTEVHAVLVFFFVQQQRNLSLREIKEEIFMGPDVSLPAFDGLPSIDQYGGQSQNR